MCIVLASVGLRHCATVSPGILDVGSLCLQLVYGCANVVIDVMEPHRVPLRADVLGEALRAETMFTPTVVGSAGLVTALPHHPRAGTNVVVESSQNGL